MKKTIALILALSCSAQLFAGSSSHRHHQDDWRHRVYDLSDHVAVEAKEMARSAHHHLERHPSDVEQLRLLLSVRGLATSVQDLSHQLEYVRADRHCLELLVQDVSDQAKRLARRASALADCRFHVRRDLVRNLDCITDSLSKIATVLHHAEPARPVAHHRVTTSHDRHGYVRYNRGWSRTPSYVFSFGRSCD